MATVKGGRVAVIGASGYGGLQTIRLLQGHPGLSVSFLGGERSAGQRWSSVCSFLPCRMTQRWNQRIRIGLRPVPILLF